MLFGAGVMQKGSDLHLKGARLVQKGWRLNLFGATLYLLGATLMQKGASFPKMYCNSVRSNGALISIFSRTVFLVLGVMINFYQLQFCSLSLLKSTLFTAEALKKPKAPLSRLVGGEAGLGE